MRLLFLLLFFGALTASPLRAQDKVSWSAAFDPETNSIVITAKIADGWHLYSQHIQNDVGPIPTSFQYGPKGEVGLVGETSEPKPIEEYDENFEATLNFFKDRVEFRQELEGVIPEEIQVTVTFMVCNETMCLPPVDRILTVQIP